MNSVICRGLSRLGLVYFSGLSMMLMCLLLIQPAFAQDDLKEIPWGVGFPIDVRTSGYFTELSEIDDGAGSFIATVDLRFRWKDLRQSFNPKQLKRERLVFMQEDAQIQLGRIWKPAVEILNLQDQPLQEEHLLTIAADGQIEWIWRVKGRFRTEFEVSHFPFDSQQLKIELGLKKYNEDLLRFSYDQHDLDYAGHSAAIDLSEWTVGLVDFDTHSLGGLDGTLFSQLTLALNVTRQPGQYFWPIFAPIFAVMIVPVLAIWLNRYQDFEFKVDAFELVNMVIGGLFAVIALNFTVNAEYPAISSGDNPIIQLFGLNYFLIALALLINIVVFKSALVYQWLGKDRIGELYTYLCWSIPLLTITTVAAIIGSAVP